MSRSHLKLLVPLLALALGLWIHVASRPAPDVAFVPAFEWPQPRLDDARSGPSGELMASSGKAPRTSEVAVGQLRVEGTDGTGLGGVLVELVDLEGELTQLTSSAGGQLEPEGTGPWIVRIDDLEFVPYFGVVGEDAGHVIRLTRGATIEARVDDGGFGLPGGISLTLLPTNRGQPIPRSDWRQRLARLTTKGTSLKDRVVSLFEASRTQEQRVNALRLDGHEGGLVVLLQNLVEGGLLDEIFGFDPSFLTRGLDEKGTATWSRVPPGRDWRWALDADLRASFKPYPAEPWDKAGPAIADCSGPFELEEGEVITVTATLLPSGAISGRIPPRMLDDWEALVEASLKDMAIGPANKPVEGWLKVAEVVPNDQGEFLFPALEPGEYRIEATWKERADLLAFDMTRCELMAFETHDVGLLSADGGITEILELKLVDVAGRSLAPESILRSPDDFEVWLYLGPIPRGLGQSELDELFVQRFSIRLDTPLSLRGFSPGPYSFRWDFKSNAETVHTEGQPDWQIRIGSQYVKANLLGGRTQVPVVVEQRWPLTAEFPPLGDLDPITINCTVFSEDQAPQSVHIDRSYTESADGIRTITLEPLTVGLSPGHKRMLTTLIERSVEAGGTGRLRAIDVEFDVPMGSALVMPGLQDTTSVTGKLDPDLLFGGSAYAAPAPSGYVPMNGSNLQTKLKPDGTFRINGLIPNMRYILSGFDDESNDIPFTTGGPGTTTRLP